MDGPVFRKVLVANRGEIAVRIMQTCREMGIRTVAVYSDVDADALHVQRADEAFCLGPAPALESYLRVDCVIEVAKTAGVDAVHPGYGFLAENAEFARAVEDAGLVWIGPPADVISLLGDKIESKKLAVESGVPVVPGYAGEDQSVERLAAEAERVGYPVMIKAAAGGGGKGMRTVESAAELEQAIEGARREARSAFGDDRIFLEKLVVRPRHVEIQVVLDGHGNGVYLVERECSLQRRHQKVVEESPSPVLTQDLRILMGEAALRLARSARYVNAGTVEFLFGGDSFYFLEVNTRIQVEHPVTEMVTGIDLVRLQIEIAAGHKLPLNQLELDYRGHAIEARIYAEDPDTGFLPATGTVAVYDPPAGPGVRNDVGIFEGAEVSPYYDPILAKLIVHAGSRGAAVRRLQDALHRYALLGLTTNIGFLSWVFEQQDFVEGRVDITWVDREWAPQSHPELPFPVLAAAALHHATMTPRSESDTGPWSSAGGWRMSGVARPFTYSFAGREHRVAVSRSSDGRWRVDSRDESREFTIRAPNRSTLLLETGARSERFVVLARGSSTSIFYEGTTYTLSPSGQVGGAAAAARHGGSESLTAPMPGTVVKVAVEAGQSVAAHEPLVVIEAMKMEHVIAAPHDGVVEEVLFREGDLVPGGQPVVRLAGA
jgi:3-methylcrotonyl-CoA carboxylase alpha subunit